MGMVRSVALSYILKTYQGLDVLSCGVIHNTSETLHLLYTWADKIFVLESKIKESIPEEFQEKVWVLDVGEDRWLNPLHPELQTMLADGITHFIRVKEPA